MIFKSNKSVLRAAVISISILLSACNSGSSSSAGSTAGNFTKGNVPLDAPITWNLGNANYCSFLEMPGVQQNIGGRVVVSTDDEVSGNGDFTGSRLFLHLTEGGPGNYTVVDNFSVRTIIGSGANVAYVLISAGTETGGLAETQWESVTGQVSVKVDTNGHYHVSTIEPLTLTRKSDLGGGIPDSPDQISFEMQNVHGVVL